MRKFISGTVFLASFIFTLALGSTTVGPVFIIAAGIATGVAAWNFMCEK